MTDKDATALRIGDTVVHAPSGRTARVIQPAKPKYVMIEWTDNEFKECPFIEWMAAFTKLGEQS